jgi:hypothetical protein
MTFKKKKVNPNFCLRRPETFKKNVIGHWSLVIGKKEKIIKTLFNRSKTAAASPFLDFQKL